jgi:hypothetical protein
MSEFITEITTGQDCLRCLPHIHRSALAVAATKGMSIEPGQKVRLKCGVGGCSYAVSMVAGTKEQSFPSSTDETDAIDCFDYRFIASLLL